MDDYLKLRHEYRDSRTVNDGFFDESIYIKAMEEKKEKEEESYQEKKRLTKKQKDYKAVKYALLRVIFSGILFLLIYLLAEFEPVFIPFTVQDIKNAIKENLFTFIN